MVSEVFMTLSVERQNNNFTRVRIRVLSANNLSDVLLDSAYVLMGNPVQANATNLRLSRQTTMAQHNNGLLNSNTGSRMTNARFSNARITSTNGSNVPWRASQTHDVFRKAPTLRQLDCVSINSFTPRWEADDISIRFNVP